MLIFGHKLDTQDKLNSTKDFFWIENLEFKKGINCFAYNEKLIQKAKENKIEFGILAQNKDEIFLANHFGAAFILFEDENLAYFGAKAAEFYLFDSKILLLTHKLENLEKAFEIGVDGIILKSFIQNFH